MGRPPRQSLTSMLIEAVTERIQSGQYKRGDQLPTEKDMIEEFGVSRTVVREAIANLKASGLVSTHQGKGAFVLDEGVRSFRISEDKLALAEEVLEALEVRIAIESEAAALAARRRTPEQLAAIVGPPATRWTRRSRRARRRSTSTSPSTARSPQATGNRHFLGLFNYLGEVLMPRARLRCPTHQYRRPDAKTLQEYLRPDQRRSITRSSRRSPPATATGRGRRSGCISAAAATGWRRARASAPELLVDRPRQHAGLPRPAARRAALLARLRRLARRRSRTGARPGRELLRAAVGPALDGEAAVEEVSRSETAARCACVCARPSRPAPRPRR